MTLRSLGGVEGTEWPPWRFVCPTVFQDIMLCTMSNIFLNAHLQNEKSVISGLCLLCKDIAFVGVNFFPNLALLFF